MFQGSRGPLLAGALAVAFGRLSSDCRIATRSIFAGVAALLLSVAVPSAVRAETFLGSANLDYAGDPAYCSSGCLTPSFPTAGVVKVTVVSAPDSYLHFDVDLADGFTFINNHPLSFGFGLNVSAATISGITPSPGVASDWTPKFGTNANDGVGTVWSYGLLGSFKVTNDLQFDVKKTGTDLTLANLIQTDDKHDVALWFIADVANPYGKTGYVGAIDTFGPPPGGNSEVPLPSAVWLFGSALAGLGLLGARRRRR